ncbi:MAG: GNAT family N-acetyltransferase [Christensenellaceae bacterium]|nr:GNAT family N-acetyltransferase [Christensenellaceae bacterium]
MGEYPLAAENLHFPIDAKAFLLHDETGAAGFFILRKTEEKEYRIGFVIIDPKKRGLGYGKVMMRLAAEYAFEKGAKAVSLAVFENNERAMRCYESAGFLQVDGRESYVVLGEKWYCRRMRLKKEDEQ